jgi:hypothetical protein
MGGTRAELLAYIAALKEERNIAILAHAPDDDVAAGQDHPDVRAIEDHIAELRDQVAALPEEEE